MRSCVGSELSQTEFSTAADAAARSDARNTSVGAVAAAASASSTIFMVLPNLATPPWLWLWFWLVRAATQGPLMMGPCREHACDRKLLQQEAHQLPWV